MLGPVESPSVLIASNLMSTVLEKKWKLSKKLSHYPYQPLPTTKDPHPSAHGCPNFACTFRSLGLRLAGQVHHLTYWGATPLRELFPPYHTKEYFTCLSSHSCVSGDVSSGWKENKTINLFSMLQPKWFLNMQIWSWDSPQQLPTVLRIQFKMLEGPTSLTPL